MTGAGVVVSAVPYPRNRYSRTNTTVSIASIVESPYTVALGHPRCSDAAKESGLVARQSGTSSNFENRPLMRLPSVRRPLVAILLIPLLLLPSALSRAQDDALSPRSRISLWYGGSVGTGAVLGEIEKGRMQLLGIRYHHLLLPAADRDRASYEAPRLTYTADLIPLTQLHIPKKGAPGAFFSGGADSGVPLTTYGMGGYPLGLHLQLQNAGRVHPFFTGHTGLLYFRDRVPDERGRRLNFAVAFGGGVHIPLRSRLSLRLEYRYHHLSNGFRGSINPGFDVNVLYFGVGTAL